MKFDADMLDYFDDVNGEIVRWCKPCTEDRGFKVYIPIRDKNKFEVKRFEKIHHWCNKDKEFQLTKWAIDLQRELTDAEKSFCRECIKENWSYDEILKRLKEPRHVMPSRSVMKNLF